MRIHDLTLRNFRVYAGEHLLNLSPRERHGKERPIILFGGLNGAGKTSILSGVRLALYGKSAVGSNVSQRRYENYLLSSIHRPKKSGPSPRSSSIRLVFSYAKLGEETLYTVDRSWECAGKSIKESLTIRENERPISGLTYDQAQTFLNELIPIGVSDLFFFDGEKIKELAEDTGGEALEQAIKKLLGLDIVERLSGDLAVLNRNLSRQSSAEEIRDKIDNLEVRLEEQKNEIRRLASHISGAKAEEAELKYALKALSEKLNSKGGHFVETRASLREKLDKLTEKKGELERELQALLSDKAPLALAPQFTGRLSEQMMQDLRSSAAANVKDSVESALDKLAARLEAILPVKSQNKLRLEMKTIVDSHQGATHPIVHDVTTHQASAINSTLNEAANQGTRCCSLFSGLEETESELDEIGAALSRAPDDSLVEADFMQLQEKQVELGRQQERLNQLREKAKKTAKEALETGRKLDKLYAEAAKHHDQDRVLGYLASTSTLLSDFVNRTSIQKIADLEEQFETCFSRLARKSDIHVRINVNPETFAITLINEDEKEIDKDDLSAGEKQIFAISVLEALAKTSGRQLPMIVDTPLGRLDSHHRDNLVRNYFPRASHQMIILSTDTEVDEGFYKKLSPDIARAYLLEYDGKSGSTSAIEGYFWRKQQKAG